MENKQKTVAIICEYNPFHFGHKYMISELKRQGKRVVGIMSGEFVQRGEVAVADKYTRAKAAVEGGMDLVLELPFPYCVSSAADFATAGVRLAAAVGAEELAFGVEGCMADIELLAAALAAPRFEAELAARIKADKSLSYPRAKQALLAEKLGAVAAEADKPNNILAMEYIAAIKREGLPLGYIGIKRESAFASSSEIRRGGLIADSVPFPRYFTEMRRLDYASRTVIPALRRGVQAGLYCIDRSLAELIAKQALAACEVEELVASCVGKTYTAARVRRAVVAAWLGIESAAVKAAPCYTALLAANAAGVRFLAETKKTRGVPVLTKPAGYKKLDAGAQEAFLAGVAAAEAAALCTPQLSPYVSPLTHSPHIFEFF